MCGIHFVLLQSQLVLLVVAPLALAQGFDYLAFAIGLAVFTERFLTQPFEPAELRLKFLAVTIQVFTVATSKLKFSGPPSGRHCGGIALRGIGKKMLQLCE